MKEKEIQQFRQPDHEVDPIFINRWSPRSFLEKEVPEEVLMRVLEAARWAPSANNSQPWRFILARTPEERELFHSFIFERNLEWCKNAPVLAVLISDKQNRMDAFDSGTAWGFLSLQAIKEGLKTHAIGGFDKEKAREVLNIPEEFNIQVAIAIGYQGEKEALPEDFQARELPSNRRPLVETIFEGKYK